MAIPSFWSPWWTSLLRQGLVRVEPAGWVLTRGLDTVTVGVPQSIRHLVEHQVAQLPPVDQELLAAASVAGVEFAVAAVAAAVQQAAEDVEAQCDALARQQQLVQACGTAVWPDGTVTARYGFRHALYQELLYERVPVNRRVRWHQQIGTRLEVAFGLRAGEMAAELAVHFEHGRDYDRAVQYRHHAAETAVQRHAHREAIAYLRRALTLLDTMAETPRRLRDHSSSSLRSAPHSWLRWGLPLQRWQIPMAGHASCVSTWARDCNSFLSSSGCGGLPTSEGSYRGRVPSGNSSSVSPTLKGSVFAVAAHGPLGQTLCMSGEPTLAREALQQVVALYNPQQHHTLVVRCGYDPGVYAHTMGGLVLWVLGYPAQGAAAQPCSADTGPCAGAPFYPGADTGHSRHSPAHASTRRGYRRACAGRYGPVD